MYCAGKSLRVLVLRESLRVGAYEMAGFDMLEPQAGAIGGTSWSRKGAMNSSIVR